MDNLQITILDTILIIPASLDIVVIAVTWMDDTQHSLESLRVHMSGMKVNDFSTNLYMYKIEIGTL